MGRRSRNKGKRGEREAAREIARVLGISARRGQQYAGGSDSPDVVTGCDDLHIEVKRTERLSLYKALDQSITDAGERLPLVLHRSNHRSWVVVLRLDDLTRLTEILNGLKSKA
ncbi:hypothetical protein N9D23_12635 [Rubripirellula sp.]|nr:hypothetical protein [Rubripirellula sp.]